MMDNNEIPIDTEELRKNIQDAEMPETIYAWMGFGDNGSWDKKPCPCDSHVSIKYIRADRTPPKVDVAGGEIPEWLTTLDYQRDLALIWMVAKQSKDYDETIGDRIERVQNLILAQKAALSRPAESKPDMAKVREALEIAAGQTSS